MNPFGFACVTFLSCDLYTDTNRNHNPDNRSKSIRTILALVFTLPMKMPYAINLNMAAKSMACKTVSVMAVTKTMCRCRLCASVNECSRCKKGTG